MSVIDEGASETLGALTSKISDIFRRWVKMGSINVWFTEDINEVQTYKLFALPTAQAIPTDWNVLTDLGVYETSESITLNDCVNCVFSTHDFSYELGTETFEVTVGESGNDYKTNVEPTCANAQTLGLKRLGSSWTPTSYAWGFIGAIGNSLICKFNDGTNWYIFGDWDKSGAITGTELEGYDINEMITGTTDYGDIQFTIINPNISQDNFQTGFLIDYFMKGVTSQVGESLLISPSGTFDIYGII